MLKLVALPILLAAVISTTHAQTFYSSVLDAAQAGSAGRTGSGSASLTLDGSSLSWHIEYSGLSGTSTTAHIHGPAAPGSSASPVTSPFVGTYGVKAGTFDGSATLTSQNITDLNAGLLYINIHSSTFGGGEIRGQITTVPEPSTYALIGASALGALALRRRRA
jgi:hypothetical protein